MKSTIQKWYSMLSFPSDWQVEFLQLLERYDLTPCTIDEYQYGEDSQRDLLMYLFFFDQLMVRYQIHGISTDILMDTLNDMAVYAKIHYQLHGKLGIVEPWWLIKHLHMKLFCLGRLQFAIGDGEIEIHIPEGEPLLPEACQQSIQMARTFFAKYFPQLNTSRFTCNSWLLDSTILQFCKPDSNIASFQKLFHVVQRKLSDDALRYVFRWDAARDNLSDFVPSSSLASKMKEYVLSGGILFEAFGELLNI